MPLGDKQEHHSTLFFVSLLNSQIGNGGDTTHKIMDKFLKSLMLLLVTALSLTFAACGGDDDEPDDPTKPPTTQTTDVTKGSLGPNYAAEIAQQYDVCRIWLKDISTITVAGKYSEKVQIAYVGNVKGLNEITTAPATGWSSTAEVHDGGGYVINYVHVGIPYYVRLMLTTNKDATGAVVGVNYAFQPFTPSTL